MHTAYPILVTIPEQFDGVRDNNVSNAGLIALSTFLVQAIESQGYQATMAFGGLGKEVVLAITRKL